MWWFTPFSNIWDSLADILTEKPQVKSSTSHLTSWVLKIPTHQFISYRSPIQDGNEYTHKGKSMKSIASLLTDPYAELNMKLTIFAE